MATTDVLDNIKKGADIPSAKDYGFANGKVADIFSQRQLFPISLEESMPVLVLRTEDQTDRSMTNQETGELHQLADQSVVHIAGGIKLIVPGSRHKKERRLPPEGEFAIVQIETQARAYGENVSVKHFLRKWRSCEDILALTTGKPIGLPLRFGRQLVCSTEHGYDFNVVSAEEKVEG